MGMSRSSTCQISSALADIVFIMNIRGAIEYIMMHGGRVAVVAASGIGRVGGQRVCALQGDQITDAHGLFRRENLRSAAAKQSGILRRVESDGRRLALL